MKIYEFIENFPDENACKTHFKVIREKRGIICKKCGGKNHLWIQSKWQWHCKKCSFRTTLRSGTALQHARLPFRKWYLCLSFMSSFKKGISAKEMQRQLNHKRYRTIWELMQKIRMSVSMEENNEYMSAMLSIENEKNGKVVKKTSSFNRFKMHLEFTAATYEKSSLCGIYVPKKLYLQKSTNLRSNLYKHIDVEALNNQYSCAELTLTKWKVILKTNFERLAFGIHHRLSLKYLPYYLDEFCFKLNRKNRLENLFDIYLNTLIQYPLVYTSDQS